MAPDQSKWGIFYTISGQCSSNLTRNQGKTEKFSQTRGDWRDMRAGPSVVSGVGSETEGRYLWKKRGDPRTAGVQIKKYTKVDFLL